MGGPPHGLYAPSGHHIKIFAYTVLHPSKIPVEDTPRSSGSPKIYKHQSGMGGGGGSASEPWAAGAADAA